MPPLRESLPSPSLLEPHSSYILASDQQSLPPWRPGRGSGFYKSGEDPIIVPKSHILLEASLRLYARDAGQRIGGFALPMIGCMEMYERRWILGCRTASRATEEVLQRITRGKEAGSSMDEGVEGGPWGTFRGFRGRQRLNLDLWFLTAELCLNIRIPRLYFVEAFLQP
ncbi:hypothetical protein EV126DRAFT_12501 [Verticillium dahliae]|nr:hypothetical protein EV126DRAFT_12501 [Verticillium dahliae]